MNTEELMRLYSQFIDSQTMGTYTATTEFDKIVADIAAQLGTYNNDPYMGGAYDNLTAVTSASSVLPTADMRISIACFDYHEDTHTLQTCMRRLPNWFHIDTIKSDHVIEVFNPYTGNEVKFGFVSSSCNNTRVNSMLFKSLAPMSNGKFEHLFMIIAS